MQQHGVTIAVGAIVAGLSCKRSDELVGAYSLSDILAFRHAETFEEDEKN